MRPAAFLGRGRSRDLPRGTDVHEIAEMKRQGLSVQAISRLLGLDRKTVRKYLAEPVERPEYPSRPKAPGKLDPFRPYLEERLRAGVWNAQVLLRELRERGYEGGYTILTDWLRPQRQEARAVGLRCRSGESGKENTAQKTVPCAIVSCDDAGNVAPTRAQGELGRGTVCEPRIQRAVTRAPGERANMTASRGESAARPTRWRWEERGWAEMRTDLSVPPTLRSNSDDRPPMDRAVCPHLA